MGGGGAYRGVARPICPGQDWGSSPGGASAPSASLRPRRGGGMPLKLEDSGIFIPNSCNLVPYFDAKNLSLLMFIFLLKQSLSFLFCLPFSFLLSFPSFLLSPFFSSFPFPSPFPIFSVGKGFSLPLPLPHAMAPPLGTCIMFLTACAARGLKPLPISKDFSPIQKRLILIVCQSVIFQFSQIGNNF